MTVRLAVAGAFHTDFMAPAREKLQEALAGTAIQVGAGPQDMRAACLPACFCAVVAQEAVSPRPPCLPAEQLSCAVPPSQAPRIPVISNVDAAPHSDPDTIKSILAQQLTAPVQWETTLKTLLERGLERSYEIGPNKVGRARQGL